MKRRFFYRLFIAATLLLAVESCSNEDVFSLNEQQRTELPATRAVHKFPNISRIQSDKNVVSMMNSAWNNMKNSASSSGRKEYGFYIYYDESKDLITCGKMQVGPNIAGCAGTNGTLNLTPDNPATFNLTVCAAFHCHTTLAFCPAPDSRVTGPSQSDKDWVNARKISGLVYDYSKATIYGGHNKNDAVKLYTIGVSQRPDMNY